MDKKLFTSIGVCSLIICLFLSCKKDKSIVIERFNPELELNERYTLNSSDSSKMGLYESYYEGGQVYERANYRRDTLTGERVFYYENGNKRIVENRNNKGRFEGKYLSFYENGQLEIEGTYLKGVMSGKWKKYYDSGELEEIVTMEDNYENGPFKEYYKNGNLKAEGNYKDGDNEHGLLQLYDTSGVLVRKMDCDRGICKTIWKKE